jgi:hypothetical protein
MADYTEVGSTRRGDDGIERNQYGHYVLPHPETGEKWAFRRCTTVAGVLRARWALEDWRVANVAYGIGQRPDLYARASALKREDESTLREVVREAEGAAAASSAAIMGSALHQFMERIDRGEDITVPRPFDADVAAYQATMKEAGIVPALGWIERVVCVPEIDICGMIDRLCNGMWSLPRVGDIKTAADGVDKRSGKPVNKILEYGGEDIPLQEAIYAHATHWWDIPNQQWVEMPVIDQDVAMVMHVPVGQGECRLYEVDIRAGWNAVLDLALPTEAWRKRKDLITIVPLVGGSPAPAARDEGEGEGSAPRDLSPSPSTTDGVRARVEAIKAHSDQARQWLKARWPVGVATFPKGGPADDAELRRVVAAVERTETQFKIAPGGAEGDVKPVVGAGKDGEAHLPAVDPPASPSGSNGIDPNANMPEGHFETRWYWARERVETIKASDAVDYQETAEGAVELTPRKLLASLWSSRDEIPLFPKGGPRDADELSMVIGWCDTVEMTFGLDFGPPDPTAPPPEPGSGRAKPAARSRKRKESR